MESNKLKKSVTMIEAFAIVIGMIIGSGIFLKPSIVLNNAGTPFLSIMAWTVGGIITLAAALSVAEIAVAIPRSGGLYTYLGEVYGKPVGFLLGWVQTVISYPASVAVQTIAFASYANLLMPLSAVQQKIMAVSVLLFLLLMNILSTKCGGVIQTLATIGKLLPIAAIIFFGITADFAPQVSTAVPMAKGAGFGVAILGTLWAYDGWISVTNMAGELKNPTKTLPKVIIGGVIFVIGVYVLFNLAIFSVLPLDHIISSPTVSADAAEILFGNGGAAFLTAGIMVSIFGSLNGYLMTAARVPYVMGEQRQLPFSSVLGAAHPKFQTPANALILQSLLAVIYLFSGTYDMLTDLLVFVLWIFFTMGVFAVFLIRKKNPPQKGVYRVPLYPITPIIGVVGGVYILVSTIMGDPLRSTIGIGITLLGIPVYRYVNKKNNQN